MTDRTFLPMVALCWADAHGGYLGGWIAPADIEHKSRDVRSIGYLVKRDETGFTIAQSHDTDADHIDNTLFVPTESIRSWSYLKADQPGAVSSTPGSVPPRDTSGRVSIP